RAGARAFVHKAQAVLPAPLAYDEFELNSVLQNLAIWTDDPVERTILARQLVDQVVPVLGPNHPYTYRTHQKVATLLRNPAEADPAFHTACSGFRRWHPQLVDDVTNCAFEHAWLADDRGDAAVALAEMQVAARDPDDQQRGTIAASYLKIASGDDAATAIGNALSVAAAQAKETQWWARGDAVDAYVTAAIGWDRLVKHGEAEQCWNAALLLLEEINQPYFERRLARVRATLARRWVTTRPDEARRLASAALDWYRSAGGYEARVSELVAIAGAH